MKYCSNCGTQLEDGANFCNCCGAPAHESRYAQKPSQQDSTSKGFVDDQVRQLKERAEKRERERMEREGEVTYSGRRPFIVFVVILLLAILVGYICNS